MNFHAAVFTDEMAMAVEVVVASAAFYVAEFALSNGCFEVCFEGDALLVVNLINSNSSSLVSFGHVMDDI